MASSKQRGIVDLNARAQAQRAQQVRAGSPQHLGEGVTDPRAVGYAAGVQARHGKLPKGGDPVAGGPPPPIPALEHPHQDGMTMAQQAMQTRRGDSARHIAQSMAANSGPGSIIAPDVQHAAPAAPDEVASPQDLMLLPQDLLPPEAIEDKAYQRGAGGRMAMNQPHMAAKYGVIRGGRRLPPQELVRGAAYAGPGAPPNDFRGGRKPRPAAEIAADLQRAMSAPRGEEAAQARKAAQPTEGPEPPEHLPKDDEEAAAQARGSAAAGAGQAPVAPILSEDVVSALRNMDDLDFEALRREMIKDILKNPKQKEAVEARCKPLSIDELIMNNYVRQRVPIIPATETSRGFEPTFESMQGDVEMTLKRLLVKESKSVAVTEAYLLDKYAVMTTTAGVVAINGTPLPSMYDAQGDFDEDLFWVKFQWLLKRPIHMLASLGIHYSWFEQRVRKLFKADEGKDG